MTIHYPLVDFSPPEDSSHGPVRVETTTLLPGGGLVTVEVRRVGDRYQVSDGALGRTTLLELGIQDVSRGDRRRGGEIAEQTGLIFAGEGFELSGVDAGQLQGAIVYVADACREWTRRNLDARAGRTERDFADRLIRRLKEALPNARVDTDRELQGGSTKLHRFDAVVALPGERFAMFAATSPAAASIAPSHLKFYDLMTAHPDWPREAVIADAAEWASPDLAMLQQVARIRPLDRAWSDLGALIQ